MRTVLAFAAFIVANALAMARADDPWVVYQGSEGPGKGKHVVLVSGDEEYRSEEGLPQLGRILATRHGFKCTVLFAIDKKDGTINPEQRDNIPGLQALDKADLMVILTRFRQLPDDQMLHLVDYVESGRPVVGLRTATHALNGAGDQAYARLSKREKFEGGFGRQVLGEKWVNHHGQHGKESTRGIVAKEMKDHPILRGVADGDIWGTSDVYTINLPLPGDSQPLVLGQVLKGMNPTDEPVGEQIVERKNKEGVVEKTVVKKNDPMMPVAWIKSFQTTSGGVSRVFNTTMGASQDLQSEGLRRLVVNACFWCLKMEDSIAGRTNVDVVGEYKPTPFGFNKYTKGMKPADFAAP
jgi:hypothetical protein